MSQQKYPEKSSEFLADFLDYKIAYQYFQLSSHETILKKISDFNYLAKPKQQLDYFSYLTKILICLKFNDFRENSQMFFFVVGRIEPWAGSEFKWSDFHRAPSGFCFECYLSL